MEKRRDEIGKLLACLLVSRKGVCDIRSLERDYYENEGKKLPYKEFGCSSSLDFFRSISNHIRLVPRSGSYVVYPVVSDKIKHVNELVSRQKCGRRQPSYGRRPSRMSYYYPPVRDSKPFVPMTVQKEIGRILTQNPQGVNKSYIAQCLERSGAVGGNVNVNNIDDYLRGMPYTATARGNMVYPSRSLTSTTTNTVKRTITDIDGFEVVAPGDEEPRNEVRNNNSQDMNSYPAGAEDDYDIDIEEDEYSKENTQPQSPNVDNNGYAANNDYQYHQALKTGNENKPKISSAEFIDRAGSQYIRSQSDAVLRENNNEVMNYQDGAGVEDVDNEEQDDNYADNADCTFESDGSLDIISPRVKTRLTELIQQCPDGLWCANLLQAYYDEYKVPLDYVELGFGSVCEFASYLPKIFHLHRQNNRGDFRLYDASKPLPKSALETESHISGEVWQDKYCEDDVDPFPMVLPLHTSQSLIPHGVMTHGESVGQERIPEIHDGSDCIEIYVVEVYTPSLFWIHLRKQRSKLSQLMESMHEFYQKEGDNYIIPHVILEKGLNCVCTFEDKWHRAIIKTVKPDGNVTLVFYDYGTTKTYPPDSVRFLVRTYSNLPAQAIPCGLYNVKPVKADAWTRGVSSEFYARVADIPLVAMVGKVNKENNSMLVSLVDTQGATDDHINDWLVHAGLAESGFMGDTVVLECSYLEDQITQTKDAIKSLEDVPLISPQSTLHENSASTLKPPPGFTKPAEPMNYAAFMDNCLQGNRFNSTEMGNSTFSNFCDANLNNNPLAFSNTVYNNLITQPEALVQFWKQKLQLELAQFLLVSNSASILNDTIPNDSSTLSSATSTNPIIEKSQTNPFQTYQKGNGQESSTVTNSLVEELTNDMVNLNTNEFNSSNLQSNKTSPSFETLLRGLSSRDSNPSGFGERNLFSDVPTEEFDKTFLNKIQSDVSKESFDANCEKINHPEFTGEQLHDTNPFKQHLIRDFDGKITSEKEQSVPPNSEYIIKPPIPPRNPNLINNTKNISTKRMTNDTHSVPPAVYNKQQTIPTTKIYYTGEPVTYNVGSQKISETKSRLETKTTKLSDSVSLRDINHHDIANSSQDLTNHSLSKNTSLNSGNTNSLQSGIAPQLNTAEADNIFTSNTKFSTNHTQFMSPRIIPNNCRPPPPLYNENNSAEYPSIKKSPISPRFTSPLMSESSKVAIEEVQLAIESNYSDKFKSVITETPRSTKHGQTLRNSETREQQHTASSSSMKNNKSTLTSKNAASPHTSYKINLILPKFLQGERSTVDSKQEQPNILYPTKILNETSGVTPSFEKVAQNSDEQAQSPLMRKEDNTKSSWCVEHQEFHNLNGASSSKNSERLKGYGNSSQTETSNHTTAQTFKGFDTRVEENAFSTMPTLHSSQTSVNEQNPLKRNYDNSNVASKGGITVDNNCFQFSNTQLGSAPPQNISYPHQQQPLMTTQPLSPLYPSNPYSQHGSNYPYHMPLPNIHPQAGQRVPLFAPNVHGFYAPAPHWPRPQIINPAFPHLPVNISPLPRQLYTSTWNPNKSHMFVQKQTGDGPRMAIPNSQTTFKTDSSKESVASELGNAQILGQEKNRSMNTVESKKTPTPPTQLYESSTQAASQKTSENRTDKFVKEDPIPTQGLSDAQVLAVLLSTKNSENSSSDNIPRRTVHRNITNVFKPVEVNSQTIYLFNIENEGWASTDEIALTFTQYENHNMILRLLELVRVQINFKEVSRAQSPLLFAELDGTTIRLPRMTNSKRIKGTLHLTPLSALIRLMYYLKEISVEEIISFPGQTPLPPGSKVPGLVRLITAYKIDDEHWTA